MKIICAGLPKTGTKTMSRALEMLGYNNCDGIPQMYAHPDEWCDLIFHGMSPNFQAMFKDVDSVTDIPACYFFEEILEAFPDSKVILTTREEESWLRSVALQFKHLNAPFPWYKRATFFLFSPSYRKVNDIVFGLVYVLCGVPNSESSIIHRKNFRMHNNRVRNAVPKEQLLEYSVTQGWKPLCDFLGCDIPEEPFPHENKLASISRTYDVEVKGMQEIEKLIFGEVLRGCAVVGCLALGVGAFCALYIKRS